MAASTQPTTCHDCHDKHYYFPDQHVADQQKTPLVKAAKQSHELFASKRDQESGPVVYTTDGEHLYMTSPSIREGNFAIHDPDCDQPAPHPVNEALPQHVFKKGEALQGSIRRLVGGHVFRLLRKDDQGQVFVHAISCHTHKNLLKPTQEAAEEFVTQNLPSPPPRNRGNSRTPEALGGADSTIALWMQSAGGQANSLSRLWEGGNKGLRSLLPDSVVPGAALAGNFMVLDTSSHQPGSSRAATVLTTVEENPDSRSHTPTLSQQVTPLASPKTPKEAGASSEDPFHTQPSPTDTGPLHSEADTEGQPSALTSEKKPSGGERFFLALAAVRAASQARGSLAPLDVGSKQQPVSLAEEQPSTEQPTTPTAEELTKPTTPSIGIRPPALPAPSPHQPPSPPPTSNRRNCVQVAVAVVAVALLIIGILGAAQVFALPSAASYCFIGFTATLLLLKMGHHLWSRATA